MFCLVYSIQNTNAEDNSTITLLNKNMPMKVNKIFNRKSKEGLPELLCKLKQHNFLTMMYIVKTAVNKSKCEHQNYNKRGIHH